MVANVGDVSAHVWSFITDIDRSLELSVVHPELWTLAQIWGDETTTVDPQSLALFNQRLAREWSIETGYIERLYSFDKGVTTTLIDVGFDAAVIPHQSDKSGEHVAAILQDQVDALDFVLDVVAQGRSLSTSFIKELHQLICRNQHTTEAVDQFGKLHSTDLLKGEWKRQLNNPTLITGESHEYCPPEHVSTEMDRLIEIHHSHRAAGVATEVAAAWLHHRFTQIHPFQDGNGRVARLLATIVLVQGNLLPLVVDRDDRTRYLDALESSDGGDLSALIALIVDKETQWLCKALRASEELTPSTAASPKNLDESLAALADQLHRKASESVEIQPSLIALTARLLATVGAEFERTRDVLSVTDALVSWISSAAIDDPIASATRTPSNQHSVGHRTLGRGLNEWATLLVAEPFGRPDFEVSFKIAHDGPVRHGVVVASISSRMDSSENASIEAPNVNHGQQFVFNYLDDFDATTRRFASWLRPTLSLAFERLAVLLKSA